MDRYEEGGNKNSENETDPLKLMNDWLLELDSLPVIFNNVNSTNLRSYNLDINVPRIDSYRISMANLEDSQDIDLDAILDELCTLEKRSDSEFVSTSNFNNQKQNRLAMERISSGENMDLSKNEGIRTESPDNDSAFFDTVSMLSSESSASSSGSGHKNLQTTNCPTSHHQAHRSTDTASRVKAEKIQLALEKMREASVQKLFIKVFTLDGSGKSLLIDENMSVAHVCRLLADKNHVPMDPKWAVVEQLPDLFMERVYEDHELLVENLLLWTRDSKNKLLFVERPDKIKLFYSPEKFLLSLSDPGGGEYDEHSRNILLEEFFSNRNAATLEVEGPLYLKSEGKKGWKRYHFILRASGLYYWPKEKSRSARDLVCLTTFDVNQVYYGLGWKKKYKAPTDFCFGIKHPRLQQAKSTKYIKFLCAEDNATLERWMTGIRVVKYGTKLMDSYRMLIDELAQEDFDLMAKARSCSVSSIMTPGNQTQYNLSDDNASHFNVINRYNEDICITNLPSSVTNSRDYEATEQEKNYSTAEQRQNSTDGRLSRASSSSSSGCLSDGTHSSYEVVFECGEFPTGTIKRKPSMNPKLPLTPMTRQLKEVGETVNDNSHCHSLPNSGSNTLTRYRCRRKSGMDSEGSGTLKRQIRSGNAVSSSPNHSENVVGEQVSPVVGNSDEAREISLSKSPVQSYGIDSPLPPPTPILSCLNDEIDVDSEAFPPPPPELFRSNLSLDNLPPPPTPGELLSCNSNEPDISSSNLASPPASPSLHISMSNMALENKSRISYSTIPVNSKEIDRRTTPEIHQQFSDNSTYQVVPTSNLNAELNNSQNVSQPNLCPSSTNSASNLIYSIPNSVSNVVNQSMLISPPTYRSKLELSNPAAIRNCNQPVSVNPGYHHEQGGLNINSGNTNIDTTRNTTAEQIPSYDTTASYLKIVPNSQLHQGTMVQEFPLLRNPKSCLAKKTSCSVLLPQDTNSPALPQKKPLPPRRSDNTRLTSPKKLTFSCQAPPGDFLKDLQRVMRKKWQVAQKCKLDTTITPHEVLGFRDPPTTATDYRETNVSNWVQEHYGSDNFYENLHIADPSIPINYASSTVHPNLIRQSSAGCIEEKNRNLMTTAISINKKRPAPPPPKRAETTQLTTKTIY